MGHAAAAATSVKAVGVQLNVKQPLTPTPSELDMYNWHCSRFLIGVAVRIRPARSGGPGGSRRPRSHRMNCQHVYIGDRFLGATGTAGGGVRDVELSSPVYRTGEQCTKGVRSLGSNSPVTD